MEQNKPSELDSMHAAYKLEFEDVRTVFIPNTGFANYKFEADGIYVQEVFVNKNVRGLRYAAKLTDLCLTEAEKQKEIKTIYTSVAVKGNETINSSMIAILRYGFKLLKSDSELIYFYKENK